MQGTIIKQLGKFPTLNSQLVEYLKKLIQSHTQSLSLSAAKTISSTLVQSTCQTRNLLHYKHLDDRTTAEKCLLLINDFLTRLIADRPTLLDHITNDFLTHILQHPTCFVSLAFFYMLARKHIVNLRPLLSHERLRKILTRIVSNFQESGQIQFLKDIGQIDREQWDEAQSELEKHLNSKVKPHKVRQQNEQINVSLSKIPPLILPSSKSIHSSRYSAISREERAKGINQLRELASAIGQSFVAVELGCLLAHKRTQQVQQFFDNSDYRNKCFEKIQTDRMLSSRLSSFESSYTETRSGFDRQMDQTNRKYFKKVIAIHINLIHLSLQEYITSPSYNLTLIKPYFLDCMDLATVGIIEGWQNDNNNSKNSISGEFFSTFKLELKPINSIVREWGERISFITQKKHLRMLWNRNKKYSSFYYEQQMVEKDVNDDFQANSIRATRYEHIDLIQGSLKQKKQSKMDSDFVIGQIALRLNQLFSMCDMNNPRFYKYETNLLAILANYLHHSFSNTVQYLAIDLLFPVLLLIKRQILQLSHPFLQKIQIMQPTFSSSKRFSKKQKNDSSKQHKSEQPLIILFPELFCNYLLVISGLISNHKHVQRLISTVFIKNPIFMETLQRYVKFIFDSNLIQQIKRVLLFYRKCLQIYNQRKLRNHQSKSIKMLFNHLSAFFYPKIGCIANKLQQKQHLISSSPQISQNTIQQHHFLHELLDFIRQIYYYCHDELSQNLLEEQIVSFYLKYSFINFIKLYSFITVNELINLQNQNYELTTKESPHVSYHPNINTWYMIDFIRIITSICINRTHQSSKKIKQYRILQFFIRQFQLEFQVSENIEKYIKKVARIIDVPPKLKAPVVNPKNQKIPSLNFKSEKTKHTIQISPAKEQQRGQSKSKKNNMVPSLKLPSRTDRSDNKESKGVLDNLISEISEKPKKPLMMELNLQLTKLNLEKSSEPNANAKSSERNLIYSSERKIRKIYSNKTLHSQAILLVLSLLLNKGLLDPEYCDQFPITHGKINALYILHHHLNEQSNCSVIPILAQTVGRIKPYLSGQRLLKLLSTNFTDLSHYKNWTKISAGAYGVIYGCETNIEQPREVAIKEMSFPKSIYERCVLHDIFTEISCLQNFRLDDRITTMYNYGVVNNAYIIVMKKYDCSLRDWILKFKDNLSSKFKQILKLFWDVLHIILLLHQKSVTHYDIKADNILLMLDEHTQDPIKVVLGDFGECRIYDQSKEQLDMKSRGTQCIKSPQMLTLALHLKKEADNYDRRKKIGTTRASDIWSLGCLFYEMLTSQYLYHRNDWVNFYMQVTSPSEDTLTKSNIEKLQKYSHSHSLIQFLKVILIRDPQHRPQVKGMIQKFKDLFGELMEQSIPVNKSSLAIQKDLQLLVSKYVEEIKKNQQNTFQIFSKKHSSELKPRQNRIRGVRFLNSYNHSKSNRFMKIMQDIFFCQNVNLLQGGYQKIKQLKITHIITTLHNPLLKKFNTLVITFEGLNLANLAFRLAPKISDLLRQVLLLKGRVLFINDETNYATNLLIYTLSYWFRCSVYQTWCLINTQILLFPTFTSDLLALSSALRLLNDVEERVQQLPKLQCICGSVTLILKDLSRYKKKSDVNCKCKRKKWHEYPNMTNGPQCITTGCQPYLEFVKKRYSISWDSIKWASMNSSNLLTTIFSTGKLKDVLKTQILLNSSEPYQNMVETGSCIKTCKVYSCRLCEMILLATNQSKEQILLVMNNMLRRIRQGIMIPNAQESYAKKTPALSFYTLTKLHMTKGPQQ